jgi:hypothetical protein
MLIVIALLLFRFLYTSVCPARVFEAWGACQMTVDNPFGPIFYEYCVPLGTGNRERPHYAIQARPLQGYGTGSDRFEIGPDSIGPRFGPI